MVQQLLGGEIRHGQEGVDIRFRLSGGEIRDGARTALDALAQGKVMIIRGASTQEVSLHGAAAAVYSSPGGTLCYEISCRWYDALVDIKLCCQ